MENLSAPWSAERVVRDGIVAYPLPAEAPMPWVATDDVAIAAGRALERQVRRLVQPRPASRSTGTPWPPSSAPRVGRAVRWQHAHAARVRRAPAPVPRRPRRRRHGRRVRGDRPRRRAAPRPMPGPPARRSTGPRAAIARRGRARSSGRCACRLRKLAISMDRLPAHRGVRIRIEVREDASRTSSRRWPPVARRRHRWPSPAPWPARRPRLRSASCNGPNPPASCFEYTTPKTAVHTLTVRMEAGRLTSAPSGIDCGPTMCHERRVDDQVQLLQGLPSVEAREGHADGLGQARRL